MRAATAILALAVLGLLVWILSRPPEPEATLDATTGRGAVRAGAAVREMVVVPATGVVGRVIDAADFPVAGITVVAVLADSSRVDVGVDETDREGGFRFDTLHRGVRFRFEARRGGRRQGVSGPHLLLPGDADEILIRLSPRRHLEVRVREEGSSDAVPGARVEILRRIGERLAPEPGATWTTGADGNVRIDLEPEGRAWLRVIHPRYVNRGTVRDVPVDRPSTVVTLDPGLPIAGRIALADDESAIQGCISIESLTHLRRQLHGRFEADGEVERDGRFRLEGIPAGTYRLVADLRTETRSLWGVTTVDAGCEGLRLELEEVPSEPSRNGLAVRVTGPDGEPVPAFRGILWPPDRSHRFTPDGRGWTFADGTMSLPAPESSPEATERWIVICNAADSDGRPLPFAAAVHGPLPADARDVSIGLERERTVTGTVRGVDGRAVAGARVLARGYAPEILSRGRPLRLWPLGEAWTDAEGAFRVGGLRPGAVDIEVVPPAAFQAPPNMRAAAGDEHVAIVCEPGASAVVTVVDADGRPIVDARVAAGGKHALTDVRGRAILDGLDPERPLTLQVSRPGPSVSSWTDPRWTPGPTTVELPPGRVVEVFVRTPDGHPVPNARVRLDDGEGTWREVEPRGPEARLTVAFPDHGYRQTRRLQATTVFGDFADPDLPVIEVTPDEAERVVVVDPGLALTLVVADRSDTETVRANLRIDRAGSRHVREMYGPAGHVRVEGLRAGDRVMAWIRSAGGESCWMGYGLCPGESTVRVGLSPGRTVKGRVLLPDHAVGVAVSVAEFDARVSVNAEGRFSVQGVPGDRLHLLATAIVSGQARARRVEVPGKHEREDEIEIDLREP